jgi:hypothetical protein
MGGWGVIPGVFTLEGTGVFTLYTGAAGKTNDGVGPFVLISRHKRPDPIIGTKKQPGKKG